MDITAKAQADNIMSSIGFPESPFKGVEPFQYNDRQIFFGREDEITELTNLILFYRGVILYGESGTGKSSLISCGVIPFALEKGYMPERILVRPDEGKEIIINRIAVKNTDGLMEYLPSIFTTANDNQAQKVISLTEFRETIAAKANIIDLATGARIKRPLAPLIIFDQFEEVITFFEEAPDPKKEREKKLQLQKNIFETIRYLVYDGNLGIKLLFSFREDYLSKFSNFFDEVPDLPDQNCRLLPIKSELTETIIAGPFTNPALKGYFKNPFSERLIQYIVKDIEKLGQPTLNLTELQIACKILWESDSPETLFKDKGIKGLYEDFFAEAINKLHPSLHDLALEIMTRLVIKDTRDTLSGERLTEDLLALKDENKKQKYNEANIHLALKELENKARLIRKDLISAHTRSYTIISEYLVPWINKVKSQRSEMEKQVQNTARLTEEKMLRQAIAQQLIEEGKTRKEAEDKLIILEKRRQTIRQYTIIGIAAICIVFAAVCLLLLKEANDDAKEAKESSALAKTNEDKAIKAEQKAEIEKKRAENEKDSATKEKLIAEDAENYALGKKEEVSALLQQKAKLNKALKNQNHELVNEKNEVINAHSENFALQLAFHQIDFSKLMASNDYKLLISGFNYYLDTGEYKQADSINSKLLAMPLNENFIDDIALITRKNCQHIEKFNVPATYDTGGVNLNAIRKEIHYLLKLNTLLKRNDNNYVLATAYKKLAARLILSKAPGAAKSALDTILLSRDLDPSQDGVNNILALAILRNNQVNSKKELKSFINTYYPNDKSKKGYEKFNNDVAALRKYDIEIPNEKEIIRRLK